MYVWLCKLESTLMRGYVNTLHSPGHTHFRRTGPNVSLPVYVNFTTVPVNATGLTNCQPNATATGDFCLVNERLAFSPGKTKLKVSTRIYNDTIAEGPELFRIQLTQPEGCLLPRVPPQTVWITDYEDCELCTVLVVAVITATLPSLLLCLSLNYCRLLC